MQRPSNFGPPQRGYWSITAAAGAPPSRSFDELPALEATLDEIAARQGTTKPPTEAELSALSFRAQAGDPEARAKLRDSLPSAWR